MKKELFYNVGRLLDNEFEEQVTSLGGEVLLLECKTRNHDAIVMSNKKGGEVIIKLGDIKKCFAGMGLVCFVFKKNKVSIDGKCCQALTFLPQSPEYGKRFRSGIMGRELDQEFEIVVDFVSNYFNGLKPKAMKSIEEVNFHIHGFQFLNSKVLMDLESAAKELETWSEVDQLYGVRVVLRRKYIHLYPSYVHHLQQNSCARDFKTLIRHTDNLPKLFKDEFSCESPRMLWAIVLNLIITHHCQNVNRESCPKVSYLKCLECGYAYYCSKQCQIEHWPRHKNFCQRMKNIDKELGRTRAVIHNHIMKQSDENKNGDSPPTFKIYRKEIERALFTAYFDVIEHTNYYDDVLNDVFGTKNKSAWMENLQALRRNRYKHLKLSSKKLESQLISVYGTKSVFSF